MRFLFFSDLHLDHAFAELGTRGERRRRQHLRDCLDRILALAADLEADAVLSGGDLYDHRHVTSDTVRFLVERFAAAGRPVFLVPGTADPLTPDSVYASTYWPRNVHVFRDPLLTPVDVAPGMRLWGAAPASEGDVLDGFSTVGAAVHLALVHEPVPPVDAPRAGDPAPATRFRSEAFRRAGFAHACVGGGHAPYDGVWHTRPGNPDPLGFDETGMRGAVVLDVDDRGRVQRQRHVVAISRVHDVTIDVSDATTSDDVLEQLVDAVLDLHGTARVTLEGRVRPGVHIRPDELSSWSTQELEIVVRRGRLEETTDEGLADDLALVLDLDAAAAPEPATEPAREPVTEAAREPAPAAPALPGPVDLGGLTPDEVEAHLATLTAPRVTTSQQVAERLAQVEARAGTRPDRSRAHRAATVGVVVAEAAGAILLLVGATAVAAVVVGLATAVMLAVMVDRRRTDRTDPDLMAARAAVRTDLLSAWRRKAELDGRRHLARRALEDAGLPTDPHELERLLAAARRDDERDPARGWLRLVDDLSTAS